MNIKLFTGEIIKVDKINQTTSIYFLKQQLEKTIGIEPDRQRLIFNGIHLLNTHDLSYYNINNNDLLHLLIRYRAGCYHYTTTGCL